MSAMSVSVKDPPMVASTFLTAATTVDQHGGHAEPRRLFVAGLSPQESAFWVGSILAFAFVVTYVLSSKTSKGKNTYERILITHPSLESEN